MATILRHPSFQGLREDKRTSEVVRDTAVSTAIKEASVQSTEWVSKNRHSGDQTKKRTHAETRRPSGNGKANVVAGITLSHPDKVLYADAGITKLDLAQYYKKIASWMLPYVANRLLSLVRCPEGIAGTCFFQKHPTKGSLESLRHIKVIEKRKAEDYVVIDDLAGLISLVQMSVLEMHLLGISR